MIACHYRDGRYAAVIICDHCQQRIKQAEMAVALTEKRGGDEPEIFNVYHAHKNECHNALESRLQVIGWNELQVHLGQLVANCGATGKQIDEWSRIYDGF